MVGKTSLKPARAGVSVWLRHSAASISGLRPDALAQRFPELFAAVSLHPFDAGFAAAAPLHHALDRFEAVKIVTVDAAVADAQSFADVRAQRHFHGRRCATSPAGWNRP